MSSSCQEYTEMCVINSFMRYSQVFKFLYVFIIIIKNKITLKDDTYIVIIMKCENKFPRLGNTHHKKESPGIYPIF